MGLVSKLKNILFEEEEVEIPVIEKKEKKESKREEPVIREMPQKEVMPEPSKTDLYRSFYDDEYVPPVEEKKPIVETQPKNVEPKEDFSERELFKSEKTFNFPAFDEQEFESSLPKRPSNVMEVERKKTASRVVEYSKPIKKEEAKPTKFRPSPIISPVYGILDKNYTPDEITTRNSSNPSKSLDVDSVRKKAFGYVEEKKEEVVIPEEISEVNKVEEKSLEEQILEEKLEKARTIDELLKDSSDEVIEIPEEEEEVISKRDKALEDVEPEHEETEEDTLENDLFDLIDSMYENREDGE